MYCIQMFGVCCHALGDLLMHLLTDFVKEHVIMNCFGRHSADSAVHPMLWHI